MNNIAKVATDVFQAVKPESHVIVDYDKVEDVLYVNFTDSPVQEADFGRRFGDYIVRIRQGLVIGVTVLNAHTHYQIKFSDKPSILTEPITIRIAIA
jgi:uncharacterized protein YuzE